MRIILLLSLCTVTLLMIEKFGAIQLSFQISVKFLKLACRFLILLKQCLTFPF